MRNITLGIMMYLLAATTFANPMHYIEFFKSNDVKINMDGQLISLYLKPDTFFHENSTALKPQSVSSQISEFINSYNTHEVELVGYYEVGSSRRAIAITKARVAQILRILKLKRPGIVVSTRCENFVYYKHLPFWKDMQGDSFFEIKWRSSLPTQISVTHG
jgi:hypothetical protein